MTGEATTTADDTVYQITAATKRVLDFDTPPTVLDGGIETVESYSVNYLSGRITFATVDNTRVITVTGKYLPMTVAAYANNMGKSKAVDLLDTSAFGLTHKKRRAGLKSASGTINQINLTDTTFADALTAGEPIVLEINDGPTSEPNRYRALLESSEISAAVDGLQEEAVSWTSKDAWLSLGN